MNAAPLLLLGAAAAAFFMFSKSSSASSSGGGGAAPIPIDDPCQAALLRVKNASLAAVTAAAALAKNPNDQQAQAALKTAQQAGQAAVAMWPKTCGTIPAFDANGNVIQTTATKSAGGATTGPCSPDQFHNLMLAANQAGLMAQATPNATTIGAANAAYSALLLAAQNWQRSGCPADQNVANVLAQLSNWQPASTAPTASALDRFNEGMLQVVARPASVPRLAAGDSLLNAQSPNVGVQPVTLQDASGASVWAGPYCGPDVQFGSHGTWPIASAGFVAQALGSCHQDPLDPAADRVTALSSIATWGNALGVLSSPGTMTADLAAQTIIQQMGSAETWLRQWAPGMFLRYLAFLYVLFADALPELTDEDDKAIANHVILITRDLIGQMGGDVRRIPQLPVVWVPRDGSGRLSIPMWSPMNLYAGLA